MISDCYKIHYVLPSAMNGSRQREEYDNNQIRQTPYVTQRSHGTGIHESGSE